MKSIILFSCATIVCNVLAFTSTKDLSPSDYRVLGLEQYGNNGKYKPILENVYTR